MTLAEERAALTAEIDRLRKLRTTLPFRDCSARGLTVRQTAAELGMAVQSIYNASHKYGISFKRANADPDIVILATVRDTAVANRGKASASQIARAVGVSRNSIIGHWFRSRQLA